MPIATARAKAFKTDWSKVRIDRPYVLGVQVFNDLPLSAVIPYIDWSPFFWAWDLKSLYPGILEHEKWGQQARALFKDAQVMLKDIIANKRFRPRAVVGFWPAASVGDDVEVYTDEGRQQKLATLHFLRQQKVKQDSDDYLSLADFVAPVSVPQRDYIGAFAVTTGPEADTYADAFKDRGDDYSSIMAKALADRFAEAMAELMHKKARENWGFGKVEDLSIEKLIKEEYRGIRPAPGYPACPDHTEKSLLWNLLSVEKNAGIQLTESMAMTPPSSVSGLYFAHPEAHYFRVSRIGRDQVEDYAQRKGMTIAEVERWLAPNLGYDDRV